VQLSNKPGQTSLTLPASAERLRYWQYHGEDAKPEQMGHLKEVAKRSKDGVFIYIEHVRSDEYQLAVVLAGPDGQPQAIDGKQVQIARFRMDGNWRESFSKLNQIEIGGKSFSVRDARGVGPRWH
jgi:hypothetical protein